MVCQIVYVFYQLIFHEATREVIIKETRILLQFLNEWLDKQNSCLYALAEKCTSIVCSQHQAKSIFWLADFIS